MSSGKSGPSRGYDRHEKDRSHRQKYGVHSSTMSSGKSGSSRRHDYHEEDRSHRPQGYQGPKAPYATETDPKPSRMPHYGGYYHSNVDSDSSRQFGRQQQMQQQTFRSMQASKQMVYDVFGKCIGMIESLEEYRIAQERHGAKPHHGPTIPSRYGRSKVDIPSQHGKGEADLRAIIDAEVTCLRTQLNVCPDTVKQEAKEVMIRQCILWLAERQERHAPVDRCDKYVAVVLQVLIQGYSSLSLLSKEYDHHNLDEEKVNSALMHYASAREAGKYQDEIFKHDHKKQAMPPNLRKGGNGQNGMERIYHIDKGIYESLLRNDFYPDLK